MSKSDNAKQSFILAFVVGALAIVISLLHISINKGKSRFLPIYIAVFLAILAGVATLMWPRSVSAQDAGISTDSGVFAQDSSVVPGKQVEKSTFVPYPDESVDAGLWEVPK